MAYQAVLKTAVPRLGRAKSRRASWRRALEWLGGLVRRPLRTDQLSHWLRTDIGIPVEPDAAEARRLNLLSRL
jgi:hypothetical protein